METISNSVSYNPSDASAIVSWCEPPPVNPLVILRHDHLFILNFVAFVMRYEMRRRAVSMFRLSNGGVAQSLTASFLVFIVVGFIRQQKYFISSIQELSESKALFLMLDDAKHFRFQVHEQRLEPRTEAKTKRHSCQIHNETLTFPEAPSFIIIGAQKSGSSALADYLKLHPSIIGSNSLRDKELHFLDWTVPSKKKRDAEKKEMSVTEDELWCYYRQKYANHFDTDLLGRNTSLVSFEKTPSYMFQGYDLPEILQRICPWNPKLLAIVRNPIDRAWSQYNMAKSVKQLVTNRDRLAFNTNSTTPLTFEGLLERELVSLKSLNLSNAPLLSDPSRKWERRLFAIPNLSKSTVDEAHRKHYRQIFLSNYLQRGMYAIQLQRWKEVFGDRLLVVRYEDLYGSNAQGVYDQVVDHIGVPRVLLPTFNDKHWSRRRYRQTLSNRTRHYMHLFFQPYNDMLAELIGINWENS
jgi:Sulfotransferase domain